MTSAATRSDVKSPGNEPAMVSIICAAYNCGAFIDTAIESVLAQTKGTFELLVVDDGSTDDTRARADRWAASDNRVCVLSQKNSGTAAGARNTGIARARGKYLCFLDGDDFFHPDRIEKLVHVLENDPNLGVAFHDFMLVDVAGVELPGSYLGDCQFLDRARTARALESKCEGVWYSTENFYGFTSSEVTGIWTGSVMLRTALLMEESEWFSTEARVGEDIDLWFRLIARTRVAYLDRSLSYYRQHAASITRNAELVSRGFIFAHGRNFVRAMGRLTPSQARLCRRRLANEWMTLGWHRARASDHLEAIWCFRQALTYARDWRAIYAIAKELVRFAIRRLDMRILD